MIGFRRGHNFQAVGSRGYIKEEVIAEQIRQEIKTIFNDYNYKYVDCSPGDMSSSEDIKYGVDMSNKSLTLATLTSSVLSAFLLLSAIIG